MPTPLFAGKSSAYVRGYLLAKRMDHDANRAQMTQVDSRRPKSQTPGDKPCGCSNCKKHKLTKSQCGCSG